MLTSYRTWDYGVKDVFLFMGTVTFTVFLTIVLLATCCVTQARSTARLAWGKKMRLERVRQLQPYLWHYFARVSQRNATTHVRCDTLCASVVPVLIGC